MTEVKCFIPAAELFVGAYVIDEMTNKMRRITKRDLAEPIFMRGEAFVRDVKVALATPARLFELGFSEFSWGLSTYPSWGYLGAYASCLSPHNKYGCIVQRTKAADRPFDLYLEWYDYYPTEARRFEYVHELQKFVLDSRGALLVTKEDAELDRIKALQDSRVSQVNMSKLKKRIEEHYFIGGSVFVEVIPEVARVEVCPELVHVTVYDRPSIDPKHTVTITWAKKIIEAEGYKHYIERQKEKSIIRHTGAPCPPYDAVSFYIESLIRIDDPASVFHKAFENKVFEPTTKFDGSVARALKAEIKEEMRAETESKIRNLTYELREKAATHTNIYAGALITEIVDSIKKVFLKW